MSDDAIAAAGTTGGAGEAPRSARGRGRRVLIIVENLPVPFDRRVWQEATALSRHGYEVSIICLTGKGFEARHEVLEGIRIYRHRLPLDAKGAAGYALEYGAALFWQSWLAWRILFRHGFDVIHACNPPDNIFLIGGFFKLAFRKKFCSTITTSTPSSTRRSSAAATCSIG